MYQPALFCVRRSAGRGCLSHDEFERPLRSCEALSNMFIPYRNPSGCTQLVNGRFTLGHKVPNEAMNVPSVVQRTASQIRRCSRLWPADSLDDAPRQQLDARHIRRHAEPTATIVRESLESPIPAIAPGAQSVEYLARLVRERTCDVHVEDDLLETCRIRASDTEPT
jgi:hypothetical protein